jgi:1,4-alpha-glucan branching enzyme
VNLTFAHNNLGVVSLDPWLEPFKDSLRSRYAKAESWIKTINDTEGGLEKFSRVGPEKHKCASDVV